MLGRIRHKWGEDRRGAVVVLVAVAGTIMVGFGAMTVDIGNMYIVRTELQRSADAAALAAASRLSKYQAGLSEARATEEARRIVEANPVQARRITIDEGRDVEFGQAVWDSSAKCYRFVAGGSGIPTAVRVNVRMTSDSPNRPMQLFFARIWGHDEKAMWAKAAAMIVPRDIAVVADLSGSHSDDSELRQYKQTEINLWNIWVCLPIEKGNNGVGNGIDPQPPGNPPINDGWGTAPGDPGNRGGADPRDPNAAQLTGPVWGNMVEWGTLIVDPSYNPTADAGLMYLPKSQDWNNAALQDWLDLVGYSNQEISAVMSDQYDGSGYWKYRVAVALGLARWDSGKSNGLWSTLPPGKTKKTKGNGDNKISSNELAWLQDFPYKASKQDSDMSYWLDWIDDYMASSNTYMAETDSRLRYRFGLKTFVNYLLESRATYEQTPDLYKTPEQPMQAVKDAVEYCMDLLTELETTDRVSLEIYGTTARHEHDLTGEFSDIAGRLGEMQAAHYDSWTNMGGGIDKAIKELTGSRARTSAAKVMLLLTDGIPNVTASGQAGNETGGQAYARTKAQEAANKGIQIYCITVGTAANRDLMQDIAEIGGGEEFYAAGSIEQYSTQLKEIFGELGSKRPVRLIE